MSNKYTWTNEMYQAMVDRADAAEARAAQAEAERDEARRWCETLQVSADETARKLEQARKELRELRLSIIEEYTS